jgi:hypothetical protein
VVANDSTLLGLGVSEFLVSGRMGILKSDLRDKFPVVGPDGCVDESWKPEASMAGFGIDIDEKGNCTGGMLGREMEEELDPDSVIGNPRSVSIVKAFLKSVSFLNFN